METDDLNRLTHHIYSLIHPTTCEIRYVGVTGKSIAQRRREHLSKARRDGKTPLCYWIRQLGALNMQPVVIWLESSAERDECERRWIATLRQKGCRLLNLTDGGEGMPGLVFTREHKEKIGKALRGRKRSPEIIAMLSRVHKGKTISAETRRKMSQARKGKTQSPETRAKRVATLTGRSYSDERRANISAGKHKANAQRKRNSDFARDAISEIENVR